MVLETEKKISRKKVIVVMPAYNAATTLERTFLDIPPGQLTRSSWSTTEAGTIRSRLQPG